MRLSVLAVLLILLFSQHILAQHNSGAGSGGSSVGSSGGSFGGGSHGGGYSGGGGSSGSSSGTHGSGGTVTHTSGSHGSGAGGNAAHSGVSTRAHAARSVHGPGRGHQPVNGSAKAQPEKKSFFSSLWHVFHKPRPKPVASLQPTPCLHGPCRVCPAGEVSSGGRCVRVLLASHMRGCWGRDIWLGGACLWQTHFLDRCSSERAALAHQAQLRQEAESERQNACSVGATQACSELTTKAQSEASFYRVLLERLKRCEQESSYGVNVFGTYDHGLIDPLQINLEHP